ncbi:Glutamyl aminopeptidase, partial [Camponotus floridanus]
IIFREADISYDEELDVIAHKIKIARFVAHEITQKYLGNLFSSSYWLDTWLNEGFTMFFQTYV